MRAMLSVYLNLAKPRILILVVVTALASAVVAAQGNVPPTTSLLLILSGSLASAGTAFLNNYFDRRIDGIMPRTQNRPLPSRRISPSRVILAGLILIAVSVMVGLQINYAAALFIFGGAMVYVVLYTLCLKQRSCLNIVLGGLSGSCAALGGWFAVTSQLSPAPAIMALLLFLWTPGHFWSFAIVHCEDYRKAGIPMLPVSAGTKKASLLIVLFTGLLLPASLLLHFTGQLGQLYLVGAAILGVLFLSSSLRLWIQPGTERAWANFRFSGIYLFGLFGVMAIDVLIQ